MSLADTGCGFQVVRAMIRATWQTLVHLLVDLVASFALPTGFAVTFTGNAGTVTAAVRIGTIGWKRNGVTELSNSFTNNNRFFFNHGREMREIKGHRYVGSWETNSSETLFSRCRPEGGRRDAVGDGDCALGADEWANFLNYGIGTIALFPRIPAAPGKLWNLIPKRPRQRESRATIRGHAYLYVCMYTRGDVRWLEMREIPVGFFGSMLRMRLLRSQGRGSLGCFLLENTSFIDSVERRKRYLEFL